MKTEAVKICAAATGLLLLAALQDVSPAVHGAKPPLMLVFGCIAGVPVAIAAGLLADALGGLPFGCSAAFFVAAALASRFFRSFSFIAAAASAALYQIWMIAWGGDVPAHSSFAAAAYAVLFHPAMRHAVLRIKRHAGIDPIGKEATR